jgi:biotin carboxyl carrier protein
MRYHATIEGAEHELEVEELPSAGCYRIEFGEQRFEADVRQVGPASFSIIVGERAFDFDVVRDGEEVVVASRSGVTRMTLEDATRRLMRRGRHKQEISGPAQLRALMPGRVVSVSVKIGDVVEANQGILVVEAMKMENEIKSPKTGKVVEVKVVAGQTVEKGELMAVIE